MTVSLSVINILKGLWDFIIGFVISIYVLASKEKFAGQAKKMAYAFFEQKSANRLIRSFRFTHNTFIGFIGGKIVDSFIIGCLCFIGTTYTADSLCSSGQCNRGCNEYYSFLRPLPGSDSQCYSDPGGRPDASAKLCLFCTVYSGITAV